MQHLEWAARFGEAVEEIGTPRFEAALLAALEQVAPIDWTAGVSMRAGEALSPFGIASRHALSAARSFTRHYLADHYSFDPNYKELKRAAYRRQLLVLRHDPRKLTSRRYEQRFYQGVGVADKISFLWGAGGVGFYFNLYRLTGHGHFSAADQAGLTALAPLAASLVTRHVGRSRIEAALGGGDPVQIAQAVAALLGPELSPRERSVLACVLRGMSNAGIALELGVAPTSVITFRKRAYQKLGISSLAELFALGMRALP